MRQRRLGEQGVCDVGVGRGNTHAQSSPGSSQHSRFTGPIRLIISVWVVPVRPQKGPQKGQVWRQFCERLGRESELGERGEGGRGAVRRSTHS